MTRYRISQMSHCPGWRLPTLAILGLVMLSLAASAAPQSNTTNPNFFNLPLKEFVALVHEQTGRSFQYTEQIAKKLDVKTNLLIDSEHAFAAEDLFVVFEATLASNGFALVPMPTGGPEIFEIIESTKIHSAAGGVFNPDNMENIPPDAQVLTYVFRFKHLPVEQVLGQIKQILDNKRAKTLAIPASNSLIVTDFASSIRRLAEIFRLMDQEVPIAELEIIKLQYLDATEIAGILSRILQAKQNAISQQTKKRSVIQITAEKRSNSLLILGNETERRDVKKLLIELDTEIAKPRRRIHYYNLKNTTNPEELAQTLSEIFNEDFVRTLALPETTTAGITPTSRAPRAPVRTSGNNQDASDTPVIVPYLPTNSLIISAAPEIYNEIEKLIHDLDRRQAQVRLKAYIFQVSHDFERDLGFELFGGSVSDSDSITGLRPVGGSMLGLSSLTVDTGSGTLTRIPNTSALSTGLVGVLFESAADRIPILMKASENQGDVNLMSQPVVTTNDNTEAVIKLVDVQPTSTSTFTDGGNVVQSVGNNAEAKTELKITPHIHGSRETEETDRRFITLDIGIIIETFGTRFDAALPPPKISREYTGQVVIPDGETVVIGGLTSDSFQETVQRIPLLGSIPLLGNLFRRTVKTNSKQNLVMFLQATVLDEDDFGDLRQLTKAQKEHLKEMGTKPAMIDTLQPELVSPATESQTAGESLEDQENRPKSTPSRRRRRPSKR